MKTVSASVPGLGQELFEITGGNRRVPAGRVADVYSLLRFEFLIGWASISDYAVGHFSQIEKGFRWAVDKIVGDMDISDGQKNSFVQSSLHDRRSSLFFEFAALVGLFEVAKASKFGGLPVLRAAEGEQQGAQPLFDFTNLEAVEALAGFEPDNSLVNELRSYEYLRPGVGQRLLEAFESSPLVELIPSQLAAEGAFDLFTASLESALSAFGKSITPTIATAPTKIFYTLHCHKPKLAIASFYQSRYAPTAFGMSRTATNYLSPGLYGFEARTTTSSTPIIDAVSHQVDAINTSSHATSF